MAGTVDAAILPYQAECSDSASGSFSFCSNSSLRTAMTNYRHTFTVNQADLRARVAFDFG